MSLPSRRQLIGSLLGATAGARLLPFLPHAALGADGTAPKRLLVVFHPMGYLERTFWPTATPDGSDWSLGATMTALAPFKNKLLYLRGLMNPGGNWWDYKTVDNEHGLGMGAIFTGSWKDGSGTYAVTPSIDQVVANALYAQKKTAFKSLALGVDAPGPNGHSSCFFSGPGQPVTPQNDSAAVFASVFKDVQASSGSVDTAGLARSQRRGKSVIDAVKADLARVCARIGAAEKDVCDAHLDAVRMMEQRLATQQPVATAGCVKPAAPAPNGLQARFEAQADLATAAFSCDLTRVATIQIGLADGGIEPLPGLNQHDTTHSIDKSLNPDRMANHQKFDRWFADRWAYLFGKLAAVKEGNGTLLDNTLVLFGSDTTTSTESEQGAHTFMRFPMWMAGGGNFAFRTGRFINLPQPSVGPNSGGNATINKTWIYTNRLLVSVARAFGVDANAFGTLDQGKGGLTELTG